MMAIVSTSEPVLLLGALDPDPDCLKAALSHAKTIVAADGGADHGLRLGLTLSAAIGDMDSISGAARAALGDRAHHIPEQDSTDFEKCLTRIDAPLVLALGFLGGRLDHGLAVLHGLLVHAQRQIVLLGPEDIVLMVPGRIAFDASVGQRVSLLPLQPVTVKTRGLRWALNDEVLAPGARIGSSNEASEPRVEIEAGPGLALIMPPAALDAVLAGLQDGVRAG